MRLSELALSKVRNPFSEHSAYEVWKSRHTADREARDYWNWYCGRDGSPLRENVVKLFPEKRRKPVKKMHK